MWHAPRKQILNVSSGRRPGTLNTTALLPTTMRLYRLWQFIRNSRKLRRDFEDLDYFQPPECWEVKKILTRNLPVDERNLVTPSPAAHVARAGQPCCAGLIAWLGVLPQGFVRTSQSITHPWQTYEDLGLNLFICNRSSVLTRCWSFPQLPSEAFKLYRSREIKLHRIQPFWRHRTEVCVNGGAE